MERLGITITPREVTPRLEKQMSAWLIGAGGFLVLVGQSIPDGSAAANIAKTGVIVAGSGSVGTGVGTLLRKPELSQTLATIYDSVEHERDLEAYQMDVSEASKEVRKTVLAGRKARRRLNAQFPLDNRGNL